MVCIQDREGDESPRQLCPYYARCTLGVPTPRLGLDAVSSAKCWNGKIFMVIGSRDVISACVISLKGLLLGHE